MVPSPLVMMCVIWLGTVVSPLAAVNSLGSFGPDGSLPQLEHAVAASRRGALAIGLETDEGVVLVCAARQPDPLRRPGPEDAKLVTLSATLGCAAAGLLPDSRMLVTHGRKMASSHWFRFGEAAPVEFVMSEMGTLALSYSSHPRFKGEEAPVRMSRPFGAALLVGGVDRTGPCLYHLDPTGRYTRWQAKAIGAKSKDAERLLAEGLATRLGATIEPSDHHGRMSAGDQNAALTPRGAVHLAARVFASMGAWDETEQEGGGDGDCDGGGDDGGSGALSHSLDAENPPSIPSDRRRKLATKLEIALIRDADHGGFQVLSEREVEELLGVGDVRR